MICRLFAFIAALCFGFSALSQAQDVDYQLNPTMPEVIKALEIGGAQVHYLGDVFGMQGWLSIKGGQPQYNYVTPDGQGILTGVLFTIDGKNVTAAQTQVLKQMRGDDLRPFTRGYEEEVKAQLNFAGESEGDVAQAAADEAGRGVLSLSQQLYQDVSEANWFVMGDESAPHIYVFLDPTCPHCQDLIRSLRPSIEAGEIQVRAVPVGFNQDAAVKGAVLLAASEPAALYFAYLDGAENALDAPESIGTRGVAFNVSIFSAWQFDATPVSLYQTVRDEVKLVYGGIDDLDAVKLSIGAVSFDRENEE